MASEITEEEDKEAEKIRIRQIIDYQKSIYFSSSNSSSFSSASASTSSFTSPRKSSRLLDLMKEGSTSLGRLFEMEHTSLGNYLIDYSVSPIIKPILLWGSDTDNDIHDDPWSDIMQIGGGLDSRTRGISSRNSSNGEESMQKKIPKRKLFRTKSYKRLPRFRVWKCGRLRFKLKLIKRLRIMIRGRKL